MEDARESGSQRYNMRLAKHLLIVDCHIQPPNAFLYANATRLDADMTSLRPSIRLRADAVKVILKPVIRPLTTRLS